MYAVALNVSGPRNVHTNLKISHHIRFMCSCAPAGESVGSGRRDARQISDFRRGAVVFIHQSVAGCKRRSCCIVSPFAFVADARKRTVICHHRFALAGVGAEEHFDTIVLRPTRKLGSSRPSYCSAGRERSFRTLSQCERWHFMTHVCTTLSKKCPRSRLPRLCPQTVSNTPCKRATTFTCVVDGADFLSLLCYARK